MSVIRPKKKFYATSSTSKKFSWFKITLLYIYYLFSTCSLTYGDHCKLFPILGLFGETGKKYDLKDESKNNLYLITEDFDCLDRLFCGGDSNFSFQDLDEKELIRFYRPHKVSECGMKYCDPKYAKVRKLSEFIM